MPAPYPIDTVIVGAGPAGLAAAACLARREVGHIVLEREDQVGWSWRNHYERLHLHTAKRFSALPYMPFPADYPRYPSRQQVVDYLEAYAERFGIAPRFGQEVTQARRDNGGWAVETTDATYQARCLVVATSYNQEPYVPDWPGRDTFAGRIVHSADYRNPEPFLGQRVMVVGAGNSGAEIALDLCEQDVETCLCVRGPLPLTTRDFFGGLMPVQLAGILFRRLPPRLADGLSKPLIRMHVGDVRKLGLRRPREGPFTFAKRGRIPLIDVGTLAMVRAGKLAIVPGVERFEGTGVRFEDGSERELDAVVCATGFHCRLGRFLEEADELTDERGYPRWHGREASAAGLYFVGYANPVSGALREIRIEAKRVAKAIAGGV